MSVKTWRDDDGLVWHMAKAPDGSDAIGFELDGSSIVVYREKPTDAHYRVVGENFDMVTGPLNTPRPTPRLPHFTRAVRPLILRLRYLGRRLGGSNKTSALQS